MDAELQSLRRKGPATIARLQERATLLDETLSTCPPAERNGDHIRVRLSEAMTLFGEVDRAAKRLEQLTEQRRECLREMTRQRALEDDINDVSERGAKRIGFPSPRVRIFSLRMQQHWAEETAVD